MNKLFYIGLIGLSVFEILNVYFIMPIPGSQKMNSIVFAYFLHSWRWIFRILFVAIILAGSRNAFRSNSKWFAIIMLLVTIFVLYQLNFKMKADKMFLQPENVVMKSKNANNLPGNRLVIGIENNGEAKAYPIEFLVYHHQVIDTIGGKPMMITYCSVCRSGRVFEPLVNGQYETFRLVGMDHFNAMFEDATTGSWWRQATGEAITGKLKGLSLPEIESNQMTIDKWFDLYPHGLVMQADVAFNEVYDSLARFEQGKNKGKLTRTDSLSWKDKSWVIGIKIGHSSKAYDWNQLKAERIINDSIEQTYIVLLLSMDDHSFVAFERPSDKLFTINDKDELLSNGTRYNFAGINLKDPSDKLKTIPAYQEFWHSWLTFHPNTQKHF